MRTPQMAPVCAASARAARASLAEMGAQIMEYWRCAHLGSEACGLARGGLRFEVSIRVCISALVSSIRFGTHDGEVQRFYSRARVPLALQKTLEIVTLLVHSVSSPGLSRPKLGSVDSRRLSRQTPSRDRLERGGRGARGRVDARERHGRAACAFLEASGFVGLVSKKSPSVCGKEGLKKIHKEKTRRESWR